MSGIFGLFRRDGAPVDRVMLDRMRNSMQRWGTNSGIIHVDGSVGFGHYLTLATPEAINELLPYADNDAGILLTFAGRVDNRHELATALAITRAELEQFPDGALVLAAYKKWGADTPEHIYGDWAFAVFDICRRTLLLARDHFGNTSLYYYLDPNICAFASSRQALLALNLAPVRMDELYLAQVLVCWDAYHGERTIHQPLRRLPPAHTLTVTAERSNVRQYWFLEKTPVCTLGQRSDYVAAFLEKYQEAVKCVLRTPSLERVAVTLSGGLDSSSVTAVAARQLAADGRRLAAFTSVPLFPVAKFEGKRFGDELPFAQMTTKFLGNVDHYTINASQVTPLQAIKAILSIVDEPAHAAGNFFWILALLRSLEHSGYSVLLTGQMGNAGISWTGAISSQSFLYQMQTLGVMGYLKQLLKRHTPQAMRHVWHRLRDGNRAFAHTAINPQFAARLRLNEMMAAEVNDSTSTYAMRSFIFPGRSMIGALNAELAAYHGLEQRDPTADVRLLSFAFSVPDKIFIDPATGVNRWLIREAMRGYLPDTVRLNRKIGRQACDLVYRLRSSAKEVDSVLSELSAGAAAAYVDLPRMQQTWQLIQRQETLETHIKSVTILTRGIMAGLFVNKFYGEMAGSGDQ